MVGNDFSKSELGRGFSGLAGVRATTRARVTTMLARVTTMLALLLMMPSAAQAQSATTTYKVTLKESTDDATNWKAKAGEGELKGLPLEGVAEGETVTLQYEGRKRVMSVRATKKAVWDGDLSKLTGSEPEGFATATNGMTIKGTLADGVNVKVTIAEGATVTLKDATILGKHVYDDAYYHAGITCLGNATIVLVGTNKVKGFYNDYPGIYVPENKTVTISGDGSLDAQSNGWGSGIGGGLRIACGNITIEGGSITATGGSRAAGIGGGGSGSCGDILITGGTIEAEGGKYAAGIGGGFGSEASCGTITITNTVTKVKATKGDGIGNQQSIGKGRSGSCGPVTVGCTLGTDGKPVEGTGKVYNDGISESPYTYRGPAVPLTMEALTKGTIKVENPKSGMQYTVNDGDKMPIYTTTEINVEKGDRVSFYGKGTDCYSGTMISGGSAEVKVYGNIMSLVDETGFASAITLRSNNAFTSLFNGNTTLKDASGLLLPATTLTKYCYAYMFSGCTSLTTAPKLPATTLVYYCYGFMFNGCTSLKTLPNDMLPAETMAEYCYQYMFQNCSGLKTLPENLLSAKTLADYCCQYMFNGCTSLTTAPNLPAEKLADYCCQYMFQNCSGLKTLPEGMLPAEELAKYCYYNMFKGCTSLTTLPKNLLPAETLPQYCYHYMFNGCSGLKTLPESLLSAKTLADYSCAYMFNGCTSLTTAPKLPAEKLAYYCYGYMFNGCTSLKTLPNDMLPAETLALFCYGYMFNGCSGLTMAPTLPATTLAKGCYIGMYSDCTALTAAPKLPATTLVESCYNQMFYNCKKLASVTCLATDIDATNCLDKWLYGAGTDAATSPMLYVAPGMKDASWNKGIFTVTEITP